MYSVNKEGNVRIGRYLLYDSTPGGRWRCRLCDHLVSGDYRRKHAERQHFGRATLVLFEDIIGYKLAQRRE